MTFSKTLTGTAAALGTITSTRGKAALIKVVTSGTETVSVTGVVDQAAISSKIMFYSLATGALHSSADMDDGTYFVPIVYTENMIFLGSGSSDTKTVTVTIFD